MLDLLAICLVIITIMVALAIGACICIKIIEWFFP